MISAVRPAPERRVQLRMQRAKIWLFVEDGKKNGHFRLRARWWPLQYRSLSFLRRNRLIDPISILTVPPLFG